MSPEVELSTSEKLHVSAADRRRSDRVKIFRFVVLFPSNAGINSVLECNTNKNAKL